MGEQGAMVQPLGDWLQAPRAIEVAIEGLTEDDLDLVGGSNGWSIRENIHHLVESNVVACNIAVAAVGESTCVFDCSWMHPDRPWMERTGYTRAAVAPAIDAQAALCRYVALLLNASPDVLQREVKFLAVQGEAPYSMTVEQMIRLEVEHVRVHLLQDISEILKQRAR